MHEMPPQAIVDPGMAIVTTGNLRGPILSILRAACAPVKISEIIERYHPDMAPRVRTTINDLEYFGLIHQSSSHVTALRGTGNPYKRVEVREVVEMARPVQEDRYTVPMPTHTPEPGKARTAPVKVKKPRPTVPCVSSRETFRQAQREAGRKYREAIWPRIEELRNQGLSFQRISFSTGSSHQTIAKTIRERVASGWVDPCGDKFIPRAITEHDQYREAIWPTIENLRNEGLSIRKIHMATNHSEQTITKILKERVASGWVDPCGDKFIPRAITEHDRENARKMRLAGSSIRAICKFLGRDRKSVLRALLEPIK